MEEQKEEKIELIKRYMRGYIDFMHYGRLAKIQAGARYFEQLRQRMVDDAAKRLSS
jgi:hypothetical protein